jgi:predicted nucleotidyltransferase
MSYANKKNKLLKRVKTAVIALAPAAEIILYGSRARATARADSDWNFLILLPAPVDKALAAQINDVELETDTVLSGLIRSKQEWLSMQYAVLPLRQQIEEEGVPV